MNLPDPKELDNQSPIHVDKWIDVDSSECRELDDNYSFTKKIVKLGFQEPAYLAVDKLGRIWGRGENNKFYPFHMNRGKNIIGYRISKRAAN